MGFLRTAALLAGGALAGYLASQAQERSKTASADLEWRAGTTQELLSATEANVAKFFDSPLGRPLQPYALRAVKFAANVKQGMNEREEQLKTKFDAHLADTRPGSLDGWETTEPANYQVEASHLHEVLESEVVAEAPTDSLQHRLKRDAELGKDFFA